MDERDGNELIFRGSELELEEAADELELDAPAPIVVAPPLLRAPQSDLLPTNPPPGAALASAAPPEPSSSQMPLGGEPLTIETGRYEAVAAEVACPTDLLIERGRVESADALPSAVSAALVVPGSARLGQTGPSPALPLSPGAPDEFDPGAPVELRRRGAGHHDAMGAQAEDLELALDVESLRAPAAGAEGGTLYAGPALDDERTETVHNPAQVLAVRGFIAALEKALRVYNLYEGRSAACQQAIDRAHVQLKETLVAFGNFILRVTPYELLLGQDAVYTGDEERLGITYRLFRDGVRELIFRGGVSVEEVASFLQALRLQPGAGAEDDSVTLLWQLNLRGIGFQAVDMLIEGYSDVEETADQRDVESLVALAQATPTSWAEVVALPLPLPPAEAAAIRVSTDLSGQLGEAIDSATVAKEMWQRALWLPAKIASLSGVEGPASGLLIQLLDHLIAGERWGQLAEAATALGQIGTEYGERGQRLVAEALRALCGPQSLERLAPLFAGAALGELPGLMAFVRLLPAEADATLSALLRQSIPGPAQQQWAEYLQARGIDLSPFHRERLSAADPAVVLEATRALAARKSAAAALALRKVLGHADWRVNVAAIEGMTDHLRAIGAELVELLGREEVTLRGVVLEALEQLSREDSNAMIDAKLFQLIDGELEKWPPTPRLRLLKVAVRLQGRQCQELFVKTVTALNPLRRKRVEERRQECFVALQQVGGAPARALLELCLQRRLSDALRGPLEQALERMA